ncbi:hypothetical protein EV292_1051, partial [Sphingomonas sp. BK235]
MMDEVRLSRRAMLAAGLGGAAATALPAHAQQAPAAADAPTGSGAGAALAPRPPMGWNSWNSFATTITEAQARETAAIMR